MNEFDYVEVSGMVAEYVDKEGRRGMPTGEKIAGAAGAILGGEYCIPNVAPLIFQESPYAPRYPFQSAPVHGVQGHERPVIFHRSVTWEQYDAEVLRVHEELAKRGVR